MILIDGGSRLYDIINDAKKSTILKISNDVVSGTGCQINFVFDCWCLSSSVSEPQCLPACPFVCYQHTALSVGALRTVATLCLGRPHSTLVCHKTACNNLLLGRGLIVSTIGVIHLSCIAFCCPCQREVFCHLCCN